MSEKVRTGIIAAVILAILTAALWLAMWVGVRLASRPAATRPVATRLPKASPGAPAALTPSAMDFRRQDQTKIALPPRPEYIQADRLYKDYAHYQGKTVCVLGVTVGYGTSPTIEMRAERTADGALVWKEVFVGHYTVTLTWDLRHRSACRIFCRFANDTVHVDAGSHVSVLGRVVGKDNEWGGVILEECKFHEPKQESSQRPQPARRQRSRASTTDQAVIDRARQDQFMRGLGYEPTRIPDIYRPGTNP